MKKKILLVAILLVCASNLFAYIYWEFDGVQPPSKKATIFHTIIAHEDIKNVKGYNEAFNDFHNDFMKMCLDGLPPAKEYQRATTEIVDVYCRNGKWYRIGCVAFTSNFGISLYIVHILSYNHNVYSQSSLNYSGDSKVFNFRQEYEQMHSSFNSMKEDFERLKAKYIDKL